ncbi:MAG: biliverdin-producing heme oxygenase [Deltaproteobacteria bacterium]|nr:biliverdin-producing heme oxygenase [Deltaproteobacteria bacterium]MDQ3300477.1 biliverdin-producing heme oxygenase [Myxococcota bacterium]
MKEPTPLLPSFRPAAALAAARPGMMPAAPSWILIRLALETRRHHGVADAQRLVLLEGATPTSYQDFLGLVLGFESAYERALVAADVDPKLVRQRVKSSRIRHDLIALGASEADLAELPTCVIPVFRTAAEALGWVYVIERNTLLHGLLRRHLATVLPEEMERASSYLAAYGDTPGEHYRELSTALEDAAREAITPGEIVIAAHAAFEAQRLWFEQVSPRRLTEVRAESPGFALAS